MCDSDDATKITYLRKALAAINLLNHKKINHQTYMEDIKCFAKNVKELEKLIQVVRIYSQDIGIEFGIGKYSMLIMRSEKQ